MDRHFILILNTVEEFSSRIKVLGIFHAKDEATKAFKEIRAGERVLTESNKYCVVFDTDDRYEVCVLGNYNNEHRLLFIAEA